MTPAEDYRKRAVEFKKKARSADDPALAAEWARLGDQYARLAAEADRNALSDLVYEPPPPKLSGRGLSCRT